MARQVSIDIMFQYESNQYCKSVGRTLFKGDKKSQSLSKMRLMSILTLEVEKAGLI